MAKACLFTMKNRSEEVKHFAPCLLGPVSTKEKSALVPKIDDLRPDRTRFVSRVGWGARAKDASNRMLWSWGTVDPEVLRAVNLPPARERHRSPKTSGSPNPLPPSPQEYEIGASAGWFGIET